MSVLERSEFIGTFRWIEVKLMETLAGWIASTPEMEVKVLFGRHVWACAQHADALGKRTFELRASLNFAQEPLADYCQFIVTSKQTTDSAGRIAVFYDVILPGLSRKYHSYLCWTDSLMDEPSVYIVQDILGGLERMQAECAELRRDSPAMRAGTEVRAQDSFEVFVNHKVIVTSEQVIP